VIVDNDGRIVFEAAVHDPVSHAPHRGAANLPGRPTDQKPEQETVVDGVGVFPMAFFEKITFSFFAMKRGLRPRPSTWPVMRKVKDCSSTISKIENFKLEEPPFNTGIISLIGG
jgi:hypothetical protein